VTSRYILAIEVINLQVALVESTVEVIGKSIHC